jgi:hypothetical protein
MLLAFLVVRILLRSLSSLLLLAYANGKGITMGDYYDYIYIYLFLKKIKFRPIIFWGAHGLTNFTPCPSILGGLGMVH